jgi:hypothetical protein
VPQPAQAILQVATTGWLLYAEHTNSRFLVARGRLGCRDLFLYAVYHWRYLTISRVMSTVRGTLAEKRFTSAAGVGVVSALQTRSEGTLREIHLTMQASYF